MKLNYPLTDNEKADLTDLLNSAREVLTADEGSEADKKRLQDLHDNLATEVKRLAADFHGGNYSALDALSSKKQQFALVASQINGTDARQSRKIIAAYHALMNQLFAFMRPLVVARLEEERIALTAAMRPYFQSEGAAKSLASQTHMFTTTHSWLQNLPSTSPKRSVMRLVEIGEKFLAGEDFWTFDAKLNG